MEFDVDQPCDLGRDERSARGVLVLLPRCAHGNDGHPSDRGTERCPPRGVRGLVRLVVRAAWAVVLDNSWLSLTVAVSAAMGVAIVIAFVLPGYTSPMSRLYTSKFGYSSLLRKLRKPFPVASTHVTRRELGHTALGEGLIRSEPVVVSIIPMGKIASVLVAEGDFVTRGQLIAEVDATKAQIKADSAEAALKTARAELERVKIGSAYVLTYERPAKDRIHLEFVEKGIVIQQQLIEISRKLNSKGYAPKQELLTMELELLRMQEGLQEAKFSLGMSLRGVDQSLVIAEMAVSEAELALKHRLSELADHKVHAIADGRIERCLIHQGEYNQDPGKPGFLITSDSWFEANFDQGAFSRVKVGDHANIRLEAHSERSFRGVVTWINPFVNYDLGGPESTRPIRPMGTGAPEWPATFAARIKVESAGSAVIPGMTGFCLIRNAAEVPCVRRDAVSAVTAGKGIVYLVKGDHFEPHEVTLGVIDGDWIEIREGLDESDELILDGYQVLEPSDRIRIVPESGEDR